MDLNGILCKNVNTRFRLSPNSFKKKRKEFVNLLKFTGSLKVASYPTRIQILLLLRESNRDFGGLISNIYGLCKSTLSAQIRTMKLAGLIESSRKGLVVTYTLTENGRQISDILSVLVNS